MAKTLMMVAVASLTTLGMVGSVSAEEGKVEATAAVEKDEMVCRRLAEAGTRIKKRVCHTQAIWDRIARDAEHEMNLMKDRNLASPGTAG